MVTRTLRLATLPGYVTLLSVLYTFPSQEVLPQWQRPVETAPAVAEAPKPKPAPVREVSRILAVDTRIAVRTNQLRPCVKQRLARVVQKLPKNVTLLVTSAHRTHEEQASLVPTFGLKARPGMSTHEDGRGVDLNVFVDGERVPPRRQHRLIGQAMASEGFRHPFPRDPVHYSIPKEELNQQAQDVELPVMTMAHAEEIREEQQATRQDDDTVALANAVAAP